jgi:hypothetical protein
MDAYEQGFMDKCAAAGVDPEKLDRYYKMQDRTVNYKEPKYPRGYHFFNPTPKGGKPDKLSKLDVPKALDALEQGYNKITGRKPIGR